MRRPVPAQKLTGVLALLALILALGGPSRADDNLSIPEVGASAAPNQGVSVQAPGETEKAPAAVKPAAKPQFTLPEVVITGDNQLTVGAKRLERREDDVASGSKELRGLSRSENDLPGLEKQRTGLEALSPESERDTVAILHGGAGTSRSWEGWGLVGTRLKGFQVLLSGSGDQYGGVSLGTGKNRQRAEGWGTVIQADPLDSLQVKFTRDYGRGRNDLPYQGGLENRRGSTNELGAEYRFASTWKAGVTGRFWDSVLESGLPASAEFRTVEREAVGRLSWEAGHPWLARAWAEGGLRSSDGNFDAGALNGYRAEWARAGLRLEPHPKAALELSMGATRFEQVALKTKGEPQALLEILPDDSTLVRLHAKAERNLPVYRDTVIPVAYTLPLAGLTAPSFIRKEGGIDVDRRLTRRLTFSAGGRAWAEEGHSQWSSEPIEPTRPVWSSLPLLHCWEAKAGLRADLGRSFGLTAEGKWSEAHSADGTGLLATAWARRQGTAVLFRKTAKDTIALTARAVGAREACATGGTLLPPYWTLSIEARRALGRVLTVWAKGDNLTGQRYEILPGYPEPRFFGRAGIELIF